MNGLAFTKAHGSGNDFVVIADLGDDVELSAGLVRALCERHVGIGADGVIRIGGSSRAAVFMDYRNADGSVVEMCGNGVRVVAKHVVDHHLADDRLVAGDGGEHLSIDTRAGVRDVVVHRGVDGRVDTVTVDMGPPDFEPERVPFVVDARERDDAAASPRHHLDAGGHALELAVASMGNPHAVIEVGDVDVAPVAVVGEALQHHPRFPEQVNVGFVQPVDRSSIRLRVYERGVGETMACGTGACAAVAVLQREGRLDASVTVEVPGGWLHVDVDDRGHLLMRGPAVEVAHGSVDAAWLAERASVEGPGTAAAASADETRRVVVR